MLPVGVDNPLIVMAANDFVNFGRKFFNSAKQHQINEIQKDIDIAKTQASVANNLKLGANKGISSFKSTVSSVPPISSILTNAADSVTAQKPTYKSQNSSGGVSVAPVAPKTVDYLNADLAKHYGLGASTAYQEALSNTAYQRAVKDMKAAGLNPAAIFGSGKGFTAGGVSYMEPTSVYQDSGSGGSSGYSNRSSGKLFSEGAYHAINTAVGLATMVAMKKGPIGYYIGETVSKAVLGTLNETFR